MLLLSLFSACIIFSPPSNQFKYHLQSQPRFLWVLQHTGTGRDKLSILETSPESVSFSIPGVISESLCNPSHSDPDPANARLQQLLCRARSTEAAETETFASPSVTFPAAPPGNSFCPSQRVLLPVHCAVPDWNLPKSFCVQQRSQSPTTLTALSKAQRK